MWQGPPMQNLTPYFEFPPLHCLFIMILLGGSEEDLRVFTSETSNAKAKSSENFLSPHQKWPNFGGFWDMGVRWYKNFRFLLQKAHPCPNPRHLSHFAWRSVEGSDPQGSPWKNAESHRTSHWNDVSPLTQGCTPVCLWTPAVDCYYFFPVPLQSVIVLSQYQFILFSEQRNIVSVNELPTTTTTILWLSGFCMDSPGELVPER